MKNKWILICNGGNPKKGNIKIKKTKTGPQKE
jgi:hypothetical protein